MDPSKPDLFLRRTSAVSLHERFSQVLVDQLTQSKMVTFDPILPQKQRAVSDSLPVVLLVKKEPSSLLGLQAPRVKQRLRRRRSVWTRLGWQQVTRRLSTPRPQGFWSFMNKYRWRARLPSTYRRRGNLWSRFGQRHFLRRTRIQKLTAGPHLSLPLQRGGATAQRGQGSSKDDVPTKRQLDAQLDEYMSLSKRRLDKQLDDYMSMSRSRLDAQLDEYMSMSRSRLDAQLDEYMSMAGETQLQWG